MTYGVERMTFRGNTLHDKLRAQYGERAAKSISLGVEANKKKRAAEATQARASANRAKVNNSNAKQSRTMTSVMRAVGNDTHSAQNARHAQTERRYTQPNADRIASAADMYATRNPYRVRINYMKKVATGKSDLEISIATFPGAYRAGMRAKKALGRGIVNDRNARNATVKRGYRPGEKASEHSAYENSVGVMANAYRRGERMRRVTQIETARPTPKSAEEEKRESRFKKALRSVVSTKGGHTELRVKRTPFPVSTIVLLAVCTLIMMVTISSFASLSQYRTEISDLEGTLSALELQQSSLNGIVEGREDIRSIEKYATEQLGMVSAELAKKGQFVSLADRDRVEVIEDEAEEESGIFATILSAISENLGALSEYIN